ncbi:hypothetical protein CFII64_03427 [Pseudomonas sp. CFII64]|jgi:hypothetical protein|uniref:hypothetical protein n=1 Tax=Pseudomonas sp. CFII64 TaxID=911242 RepID=UPI00035764F2|nr:hypothetical protein [Pseudomonas sp. CFII64]EPJ89249.1 hypothetical protein CFII64_03427 [Pseudomonas sp. CFII64]
MDHVGQMIDMQEKGLTVLSGPFMEKAGGPNGVLADGGMTIFKVADRPEQHPTGDGRRRAD